MLKGTPRVYYMEGVDSSEVGLLAQVKKVRTEFPETWLWINKTTEWVKFRLEREIVHTYTHLVPSMIWILNFNSIYFITKRMFLVLLVNLFLSPICNFDCMQFRTAHIANSIMFIACLNCFISEYKHCHVIWIWHTLYCILHKWDALQSKTYDIIIVLAL